MLGLWCFREEEKCEQLVEEAHQVAGEADYSVQLNELQADTDKWRKRYEDLWHKVKPFEVHQAHVLIKGRWQVKTWCRIYGWGGGG